MKSVEFSQSDADSLKEAYDTINLMIVNADINKEIK